MNTCHTDGTRRPELDDRGHQKLRKKRRDDDDALQPDDEVPRGPSQALSVRTLNFRTRPAARPNQRHRGGTLCSPRRLDTVRGRKIARPS
eukprot:SAG31_NODE_327_length_17650_cov_18.626574_3_plen_90_part_00